LVEFIKTENGQRTEAFIAIIL